MLPEIQQAFQDAIDYWLEGVKEIGEAIFGPDANEDSAFVQSASFHAKGIMAFDGYHYSANPPEPMWGKTVVCTLDLYYNEGTTVIGNAAYVGKGYNNNNPATDAEVQHMMGLVNGSLPTIAASDGYVQSMLIGGLGGMAELRGFKDGNYDSSKVYMTYGSDQGHKSTITGLAIYNTGVEYTVNENQIISTTGATEFDINPSLGAVGSFWCLKSYPYIGNVKNITYINDFINKQVSTGQSVHNYTRTYVTPEGYTINVYYGDNYTFTHVVDDEPVSYNDLKNAIQIAITQINEDNDGDISVPPYNPAPPTPPAPDITSDNQVDGGNYSHANFTKIYTCTSAELDNLYKWMCGGAAGSSGDSPVTVPNNFDPMERIVGLLGYPMVIDAGVSDATTFTFRDAENQTVNTGWSTYKYGNFDRVIDFGSVTIPLWEDQENGVPFLDYSSTVEIYVPFCGVVGLDPQSVMGCTLKCKMWIDFATGDCSAIIYTNYGGNADSQHPVAFVSGNCSSSEVMSANAFGAFQGAKAQAAHKMSQAILGGVKNLATSVIGGATTGFTRGAANPSGAGGSAGMKAGAIGSVIGGAMDLGVNLTLQNMDNRYAVQVAKNALGTTISGSFGNQTSWYYPNKPYIKVTWPTPISKDNELYGKTFGIPTHKSDTLSNYTGYTICNNVDVSGISGATAEELAMIKQFLETGVYIKEGGEG